jgi:hypothetical protein
MNPSALLRAAILLTSGAVPSVYAGHPGPQAMQRS